MYKARRKDNGDEVYGSLIKNGENFYIKPDYYLDINSPDFGRSLIEVEEDSIMIASDGYILKYWKEDNNFYR